MSEVTQKKKIGLLNGKHFTGEKDLPTADIEPVFKLEEIGNGNDIPTHKPDGSQSLLQSCKIDLREDLAPPPIAMQIMSEGEGIPLFTKGNFSILTGAAKSRKTFLISILIAAAIVNKWFQSLFYCPGRGINIVFDTEQSRYKTQQNAKRIARLCQENSGVTLNMVNDSLHVYTLRTQEPAQRIEIINKVLATTPNINFVAIDGIIDLDIDPILEAKQAQNIIQHLMEWTEKYNIHIVCVLHYNKTVSTLLGHLGSFAHRKADAVIEVSKSKDDENISLVKAVDCREREFFPFAFSVDQTGLPYILTDYMPEVKQTNKKSTGEAKPKGITAAGLEKTDHDNILNHVFKIEKNQAYNELWRNLKNTIEFITGYSVGDNKAKDFVSYYLQNESLIKTDIPKKKPVYCLPGQKDMFSV